MVAFPDSSTEPALLSVTDMKLNNRPDHDGQLVNESDAMKVKDHAFTISRWDGKDNYALDFDCMEKGDAEKVNGSPDIKAEPDVVKKVAGERRRAFDRARTRSRILARALPNLFLKNS